MKIRPLLSFCILIFTLNACSRASETPSPTEVKQSVSAISTSTPLPTVSPLMKYIAIVNEQGLAKAWYTSNLNQLLAALASGAGVLPDNRSPEDVVLDELINLTLLSQAARASGFMLEDEQIEQRLQALREALGETGFTDWLYENGYSEDLFREVLKTEIEASWQRDQIYAQLPSRAEQIEAVQLFFYSEALANHAYTLLQEGASFEEVAAIYDPENLGYLGWFPRGSLLLPEVENLAFSLQLYEYSDILQSEFGFHILMVIDYEADREIASDALMHLQDRTLATWLAEQRNQSQIELLEP